MRAIVRRRYGSPEDLELVDLPEPEVGPRDVLIQVMAASVNRSDWETLTGRPLYARLGGLRRPAVPVAGSDAAGRIAAVGDEVGGFTVGDEVIADAMYQGVGTFAEYVRLPESAVIVPKPPEITFETAATLPQAGVIALQGIGESVEPDRRVLVNGAGGGAGVLAVQLAKAAGAHVTGVDNTAKADLLRSLGADEVIDYTVDDYTRSGSTFDLILDLVCRRSIFSIRRVLAPGGRYSVVGGSVPGLLQIPALGWAVRREGRRFGVLMVRPGREDLATVAKLVAAGALQAPIDGTYPLAEAAAALERVGHDRALGKVVITT